MIEYDIVHGPELAAGVPARFLSVKDLQLVSRHGWRVLSVSWEGEKMVAALLARDLVQIAVAAESTGRLSSDPPSPCDE